jgi:hypothetical protein
MMIMGMMIHELARLAMLLLHMCMPHDYMRIGSITNFIDSTS